MKILFFAFAMLFGAGILMSTGIRRLCIFLVGISLLFNNVPILTSPYLTVSRFLILCFTISIIVNWKQFRKEWSAFPLRHILSISLLNHLLIGLFDERLSLFNAFYRSVFQFATTFFLIFIGYVSVHQIKDIKKLVMCVCYLSIVVCSYGILTFFLKSNIYDSLITGAFDLTSTFAFYLNGDRGLRVNAFTYSPITYGAFTSLFFLFLFPFYSKRPGLITVSLILLSFSCFLSNSRSPIFAFAIGLPIFILFNFSLSKKIRTFCIAIFCFYAMYSVPIIQQKVDSVADVFITGGEETSGSNVSMRQGQFLASMRYYSQNPLWGNGYGYFYENITRGADDGVSGDELYGAESYLFTMMIEEGGVQIVLNLIIFGTLFYCYFNGTKFKPFRSLGLASCSMFLIVAFSTGTVQAWQFYMPFLGVFLKGSRLIVSDSQQFNL